MNVLGRDACGKLACSRCQADARASHPPEAMPFPSPASNWFFAPHVGSSGKQD